MNHTMNKVSHRPPLPVIAGFLAIGAVIAISAFTLGYHRGVARTGEKVAEIAGAICTNESEDYAGWFFEMDDIATARCMSVEDSAQLTPATE